MYVDDNDSGQLIDAPVSKGDGFSFAGGKYADEVGPAGVWEARGASILAYPTQGGVTKAKDPIFGLPMGEKSQTAGAEFRWHYVEEGPAHGPAVLLLHGLPSQAFSFRAALPPLAAAGFRAVAVDWLGFGFSDKPQPRYGFDYTLAEYAAALDCLVKSFGLRQLSIVAQGYFVPAVTQYALANQDKVDNLILVNPPVVPEHAKLPGGLSAFANFLLGEIFAQDPLRASDKLVGEVCHYQLEEEDAMVYRYPYLTSGMSGFALTAVTRALQKDLKAAIAAQAAALTGGAWKKRRVAILWGRKDRWLTFRGVPEFARASNATLLELPEVGHHAQEDFGEEVGAAIGTILRRGS